MPAHEARPQEPSAEDESDKLTEQELRQLGEVFLLEDYLQDAGMYKTLLEVIENRGPAIRDSIRQSGPHRQREFKSLLDMIDATHPPEA